MLIYRFKYTFEDQDDFSREMQIKVDQTFYDFYQTLIKNLDLDPEMPAAFYLSDHKFRKKRPIYLPGFKVPENNKPQEEEGKKKKILRMDKCHLNAYVDDPHQRFLFIYDLAKEWTFYIELLKIAKVNPAPSYPLISSEVGPVPIEISRKQRLLDKLENPDEEDFDHLEEEDMDDENAYEQANLMDSEMDEMSEGSFFNDGGGNEFDEDKL